MSFLLLCLFIFDVICGLVQSQDLFIAQCTPIINDIMLIQSERDLRMEAMQRASRAHKNHEMSRESHTQLFDTWHQTEAQLRSSANRLFIQAETIGCL